MPAVRLDRQRRDPPIVDQNPLAGADRRGAQRVDGDRPLRAASVGMVRGVEFQVDNGLLQAGHEVEQHQSGCAAAAVDPRAEDRVVDRRRLVHGPIDGAPQQALVHVEEQVRTVDCGPHAGHRRRRLPRLLRPGQQRADRIECIGRAGGGPGRHGRREFFQPLGIDSLRVRILGGIGGLRIGGDGATDCGERRHLQAVLLRVEKFLEAAQHGGVGGGPGCGLGGQGRPVEIRFPGGATRAAGQQPVERS